MQKLVSRRILVLLESSFHMHMDRYFSRSSAHVGKNKFRHPVKNFFLDRSQTRSSSQNTMQLIYCSLLFLHSIHTISAENTHNFYSEHKSVKLQCVQFALFHTVRNKVKWVQAKFYPIDLNFSFYFVSKN